MGHAPYGRWKRLTIFGGLSLALRLGACIAIEPTGCGLLLLPPYSPDFNSIEQAWSKLKKALLRGLGGRTKEALETALTQILDAITTADTQGWFAHCGYAHSNRSGNCFSRAGN